MNCHHLPSKRPARHTATFTSVEMFHQWVLVTALPAGVIILLVLLRKQLQKLFTICCRRNPECCCTPCCVRHKCCGLADDEKRKKQASEQKRKLSTSNKRAESQQRLLDPVSNDAESRIQAAVAAEKESAGKCDSGQDFNSCFDLCGCGGGALDANRARSHLTVKQLREGLEISKTLDDALASLAAGVFSCTLCKNYDALDLCCVCS